ncbi:hypothetical protein MHBO_000298 [Bonamia ostreae]|uniref:Anaphase-promoting complex subunit 1 n=1 Tax=Bonamia ostreae TaxID=126728 RepID=A0ABV2AF62_9EUKA
MPDIRLKCVKVIGEKGNSNDSFCKILETPFAQGQKTLCENSRIKIFKNGVEIKTIHIKCIEQVLWSTFSTLDKSRVRMLCVLASGFFKGILVERAVEISGEDRYYSLTHPLGECKKIGQIGTKNLNKEQVIFTSLFKPIVVTMARDYKHRVYFLRRTTREVQRRLSLGKNLLRTPNPNRKTNKSFKKTLKSLKTPKMKSKSDFVYKKRFSGIFTPERRNSKLKSNVSAKNASNPENRIEALFDFKFELPLNFNRKASFSAFEVSANFEAIAQNPIFKFEALSVVPVKSIYSFYDGKQQFQNFREKTLLEDCVEEQFYDDFYCNNDLLCLNLSNEMILHSSKTQIARVLLNKAEREKVCFIEKEASNILVTTSSGRKVSTEFEPIINEKATTICLRTISTVVTKKKFLSFLKKFLAGERAPDQSEFDAFINFCVKEIEGNSERKPKKDWCRILRALHCFYESLKLDLNQKESYKVAELLTNISLQLGQFGYTDIYFRDFASLLKRYIAIRNNKIGGQKIAESAPFDFYKWLSAKIERKPSQILKNAPLLNPNCSFLERLRKICLFVEVVFALLDLKEIESEFSFETSFGKSGSAVKLAKTFKKSKSGHLIFSPLRFYKEEKNRKTAETVSTMLRGITTDDFVGLPDAISLILRDILAKILFSQNTKSADLWKIAGREDIALNIIDSAKNGLAKTSAANNNRNCPSCAKKDDGNDKTTISTICANWRKTRFTKDLRLKEVERCLCSSKPQIVAINCTDEEETVLENWKRKDISVPYKYFQRTCAMPLGRALFLFDENETFSNKCPSHRKLSSDQISTSLRIKGSSKEFEIPVDSRASKIAKSMGEFHSGAAFALSLPENMPFLGRNEILGFPKESLHAHSGFLLGIGAKGYLSSLDSTDLFDYFQSQKEVVSVALLLGFSLRAVGSMDFEITKMVSLHVPNLMPSTLMESEKTVPSLLQSVAILCLGLLYMSSGNTSMNKVILEIITKSKNDGEEEDLGQLHLSSSLAYGLVNLGKGCEENGNCCNVDAMFLQDSNGGTKKVDSNSDSLDFIDDDFEPMDAETEGKYIKTSLTHSGTKIDLFVTAPGSLLALGFIHYKTNNSLIGKLLEIKNSANFIDNYRGEFAFYRLLSRNIVMWNDIQPTVKWLKQNIPPILRKKSRFYRFVKGDKTTIKFEETVGTNRDSFCLYSLLGCCTALAIKFCGSRDARVLGLLMQMYNKALSSRERQNLKVPESCFKSFVVGMATNMAVVMAGSCDLSVFKILRRLRKISNNLNSSENELVSMAIGFLFMGGGRTSLTSSDKGTAGLLISILPLLISRSFLMTDVYPPFFRYLWILAADKRHFETIDSETGQLCNTVIEIDRTDKKGKIKLLTPCLLPERREIKRIKIVDKSFWPQNELLNENNASSIFVKRKFSSEKEKLFEVLTEKSFSPDFGFDERIRNEMKKLLKQIRFLR